MKDIDQITGKELFKYNPIKDQIEYYTMLVEASYMLEMSTSLVRSFTNNLPKEMAHLLKWKYQTDGQSTRWIGTIREQQKQINKILSNTSNKNDLAMNEKIISNAYKKAVADAMNDTKLPRSTFPENVHDEFTIDNLSSEEWVNNYLANCKLTVKGSKALDENHINYDYRNIDYSIKPM